MVLLLIIRSVFRDASRQAFRRLQDPFRDEGHRPMIGVDEFGFHACPHQMINFTFTTLLSFVRDSVMLVDVRR